MIDNVQAAKSTLVSTKVAVLVRPALASDTSIVMSTSVESQLPVGCASGVFVGSAGDFVGVGFGLGVAGGAFVGRVV
ncbi:MAG: hypothetical protein H0T17_00780, partial [Propionibacteriales bacterium]|nr:hypothetical protein [Propionibacteriales bacterium]